MKAQIDPKRIAAVILLLGMLVGLAACAQPTLIVAPTLTPIPDTATPQPSGTPPPTPTLVNWTLSWSDEFNSADGSAVDPATWTFQTGGSGWGNAELEYYTDRLDNAYIENPAGEDGVLVIKAIKEDYEGRKYTSARLTTRRKVEQLFGRVEIRAQIPYGQGIWPALWMLGNTDSWPSTGEIDIMENIGKEPNIVHGTIHGPGYSGAKNIGKPYSLPDGANFSEDYHLYAIEWEPNVIRFYVDNVLYHTVTPADLPEGTKWVYDHPFYLIMNVAVGGGWPGFPNSTTEFPQTMKVDYVRIYTRPGGWPTLTPVPSSTPKP